MWPQTLSALLGIWLTAAPGVLGYGGPARAGDLVAGPLAASLAVVASSEVTRPVRWAILPLGLWLVVSPWVLDHPADAAVNTIAIGVLLAALACVRGQVSARYAAGWSGLWRRA